MRRQWRLRGSGSFRRALFRRVVPAEPGVLPRTHNRGSVWARHAPALELPVVWRRRRSPQSIRTLSQLRHALRVVSRRVCGGTVCRLVLGSGLPGGPGSAPRLSAGALSRSVSGLRGTRIRAHQRGRRMWLPRRISARRGPQCREHSLVPCVAGSLRLPCLPRTRMHTARAPGLQCRGSRAVAEVGDPLDGNRITARCGRAYPHGGQPSVRACGALWLPALLGPLTPQWAVCRERIARRSVSPPVPDFPRPRAPLRGGR